MGYDIKLPVGEVEERGRKMEQL